VYADTALAGLPAGPAGLPTWFTRLGFVDREGTAFELFAVEPLNGGFGGCTIGHLDKAKAFGAARVPVGNHIDCVHNSILLKELAEVMIRRTIRKVPYKDIHAQVLFMVKNRETIARSSETVCRSTRPEHDAGETAKRS
jgi:hypothetical protein